jgi:primosomal protein N' (replication factor Y)
VLGPAPAPLALLRGRTRLRFLVKAGRNVNIQSFVRAWLEDMKIPNAVRVSVDVDPYSFM